MDKRARLRMDAALYIRIMFGVPWLGPLKDGSVRSAGQRQTGLGVAPQLQLAGGRAPVSAAFNGLLLRKSVDATMMVI